VYRVIRPSGPSMTVGRPLLLRSRVVTLPKPSVAVIVSPWPFQSGRSVVVLLLGSVNVAVASASSVAGAGLASVPGAHQGGHDHVRCRDRDRY
jgi:hypothetical protein